ncbi:NUDIX hydrolase [Jeongeupia chitinilytica]|uniref:Nudix hydrolase domain-containing protein n=1 Tax=Jeongeupia chitinilytica TaxID=1041641 RepID=A0ABQ3H3U8_9NEIS|nr:DUF4743 domain-containing protein [Jeongeupia chitinilytica]GHD63629.1 hypothetical protein GCM10007350_21460 [Jeongeupia chitinilytica]
MNTRLDRQPAVPPRFDASGLIRFHVQGEAIGWLEPDTCAFLQALSPRFTGRGPQLHLDAAADQIEPQLERTALAMRDAGLIRGWRNERYTCFAPDAHGWPDLARPLFALERAAFRRFGLTSRAVHINGHTADRQLWIGRRSASKAIDPDRLDNLAAGGIASGETAEHCVVRELWEEAGVPAEIAGGFRYATSLRSTRNEPDGTHDEVLYCYDLLLPDDFVPCNTDGEVAGFARLSIDEILSSQEAFTVDALMATTDFLRRQDWV